jgi:transposase
MGEVSTIGLDIAKSVFQVHGVDVAGAVVVRKRVNRARVLEYFGDFRRAWWGSKHVPPRITGAASFKRLVTRSD